MQPEIQQFPTASVSTREQEDLIDVMEIEVDKGIENGPAFHEFVQTIDYDPIRSFAPSSPSNAPPKRFYRTFWRSAARRILNLANQNRLVTLRQLS